MKARFLTLLFIILGCSQLYCQSDDCSILNGAWIYDLPDTDGMVFAEDGRVLWVMFPKNRSKLDPSSASQAEKAAAFEGLNINAGTWTCDGKRGTVTWEYAADPNFAGTSFSFDFKIEGDMASYIVINEDGSSQPMGRSHKVADSSTASPCGPRNGFWRYELPEQEGYFAFFGNFFGWIVINKDYWSGDVDLSTVSGKAQAYDAIIADAGTFSCNGRDTWSWNKTYAKNPAETSIPMVTDQAFQGSQIQWWFLNDEGKRIGAGGKAVKVE